MKLNPVEVFPMVFLVTIAIVVLVFCLSLTKFLRIWLQSKFSGAVVTFAELIGMWLRKVNVRETVLSRIMAVQAGLDVTRIDLESHYLAGGNVAKVAQALILARRKNMTVITGKDLSEQLLAQRTTEQQKLEIPYCGWPAY